MINLLAMPPATPTVDEFLSALPPDQREAMSAVHQVVCKAAPRLEPYVATNMGAKPALGYGKYRYKGAGGRETEWFTIGLVAGKSHYSLYICAGDEEGYLVEQHADKLGKVKTGRSCINFKKVEDLKLPALMTLVKAAAKAGGINAVG